LILAFVAALLALVWAGAAEAQRVIRAEVDSPALGRPLTAAIWLPTDGAPPSGLPVAYLLHGTRSEGADWVGEARIAETAGRLLATGAIRPMIMVMPDAGQGWYVDSAEVGGPGDWAQAIGRDLPMAIEARFAARTDVGGRAIAGISMGGYGALSIAFQAPGRWGAAASLSGAFWTRTDQSRLDPARIDRIFHGSFGRPFQRARFAEAAPWTRVARLADAPERPSVLLTAGEGDLGAIAEEARELHERLSAMGVASQLMVTQGGHDWATWAGQAPTLLAFLDARFGMPR
jgi:enterochelin esterase family protein